MIVINSLKYLRSSRLDKVSPHELLLYKVREPSRWAKAPISLLKLKSIHYAIPKYRKSNHFFFFKWHKNNKSINYLLFHGIWSRDMYIYCKRKECFHDIFGWCNWIRNQMRFFATIRFLILKEGSHNSKVNYEFVRNNRILALSIVIWFS